MKLKAVDIIESVFMCLCRNDIRERSDNTKKCQWFQDASPGSSARAQGCHGLQFVGPPWFPPSPQLILGEDYVTPVLKDQRGGCWKTDPDFISSFLQRQGCARLCPCAGHCSQEWGTLWDTTALPCQLQHLTLPGELEICFNSLPSLSVGSFEGCGCCGK